MILLSMNPLGYQAEPTYFKNTGIIKRSLLTLPILKSGHVNIKGPLFTFRHATRPPTAAYRLAIRVKQPYGEQFHE